MPDDILLQVNKPARYIGQEWNLPKKDFAQSNLRFALCFPDLYEVGMSNLGLRSIYGILNNIPDASCERFFSCNSDLEGLLRSKDMQILSIESKTPLKDFDVIGFSLGSELGYTNVLNILDLGSIPLEAALRDHTCPLVIAGGPCVLNPEPMHAFFDLFVIGEAEDLVLEFVEVYRKNKDKFKKGEITKQDLLFLFSQVEGIYVPSLYDVTYNPNGSLKEFKPKIKGLPLKIKKRIVKDLNCAYFPKDWLVPYIQIIHDRVTIEVMRGCPNRCRFCQARSQYFPFRYREVKNILDLAGQTYKRTGYEEFSLCGLSVSDYPHAQELLASLINLFKPKSVSVSLPSIKAKAMVGELSSLIASIKKTGLTFAPETGSVRLRSFLGKDFDEEEFFSALRRSYSSGYQHVKLYFMIGLPGEEQEDLDAIIDLSVRVSELRREINKKPAQVNISINTLIPKPHTPFQWFGMQNLESIKDKQNYLRDKMKRYKKLKLDFHNRYMSFLEGVLSRGDRRLSEVILCAFRKGARFDAWESYFSFDKWFGAFKESNIDPHFYLKEKTKEECLAWDIIDVGITKDALIQEFNKVIAF